MIRIKDVTFAYAGKPPIFSSFNWNVTHGERWCIIGPSGCGKTTLLYLLAGLRRPAHGTVDVNGKALEQPRSLTGLILQDYGLLPWATAQENVALGLKIRGINGARRTETVREWMERLDIAHVSGNYPAELSGGQRQRVAIARTLALNPDLLLMDEPFASLDALTRENLQELTLTLGQRMPLTTILVTHNIEEAVFMGKKILVLKHPPVSNPIVIDNSASGSTDFRGKPAFYRKCEDIREALEESFNEQRA